MTRTGPGRDLARGLSLAVGSAYWWPAVGGYLSVTDLFTGVRAWAALCGRPGFPRARLRLSLHRDTCHTVEWGPQPPEDDAACGQFYGYSTAAIQAFLLTRVRQ